jgi:tRNA A-37 threonylcarbamoyl transferase component Bud32
LPEWFLPDQVILKCQKKGTDVEHGDDKEFEQLFEAEHQAYNRLWPIQGLTIPRCYGLTHFHGRKALILQHCPGQTLEQPEAATLSSGESKRLLGDSFKQMAEQGAVQEDANISNFILAPDKRSIMAVDLEYVTFPSTSEDIEYHSLSSMQTTLENYLGRQRFLRSDGYLEAASCNVSICLHDTSHYKH